MISEAADRRKVRRQFAHAAAGLLVLQIGVLLYGILFDAGVTGRLKELTTEYVAVFGFLSGYLYQYINVGSAENRQEAALAAGKTA